MKASWCRHERRWRSGRRKAGSKEREEKHGAQPQQRVHHQFVPVAPNVLSATVSCPTEVGLVPKLPRPPPPGFILKGLVVSVKIAWETSCLRAPVVRYHLSGDQCAHNLRKPTGSLIFNHISLFISVWKEVVPAFKISPKLKCLKGIRRSHSIIKKLFEFPLRLHFHNSRPTLLMRVMHSKLFTFKGFGWEWVGFVCGRVSVCCIYERVSGWRVCKRESRNMCACCVSVWVYASVCLYV